MTKEKLTYVSPETETLVVRFEGVICASPWGSANQPGQGLGESGEYTYGY
jgi:hypothetical protein